MIEKTRGLSSSGNNRPGSEFNCLVRADGKGRLAVRAPVRAGLLDADEGPAGFTFDDHGAEAAGRRLRRRPRK